LGLQLPQADLTVSSSVRLCGFPPFAEDENGLESVYLKIRSGALDFPHPYWTHVSEGGKVEFLVLNFPSPTKLLTKRLRAAKDLIRNLLNVSAQDRFSAEQALSHPWIKGEYSEKPLSSAIMEMKRFNQKRRFN
jgi:serine/threonine protein kinase